MNKKIEQRICLKFCIANGISCAESLKMLQKAYDKSTLSKTRAYEWYSALKNGRDVVKTESRIKFVEKGQICGKKNPWILHHDNAPSHKAIIVNEFLAKNSTNIIEQPPYSPDMAPADFFLFPKLKLPLRGTRFNR
ncbi:hypothetical protein ALC57_04936 [Trachymyrmex cornetzi]|uniref:Mos1 transposase HTH domain-containing protein n=1 Tax=Trachymyrmex cornetzi TaxID=471704 RepID=A0A151JCE4_9HYME|nr:hypothetical protein ALC57_04936 [Trachymyrmex cornetzi]